MTTESNPDLVLSEDQEGALAEMTAKQWNWGALFLTGPAGTGKSTVLRAFKLRYPGNVVVVAPTGIAAINCGGQTIHRLFRFPPRFIRYRDPDDIKVLWGSKKQVLRKLDTLIIDEISMVRADVMDAIDWSLRIHTENLDLPFGGKRVIVVGDVMQLPPVIRNEDIPHLREHWHGGFFFDANVWREAPLGVIELRTIHRQSEDITFAGALQSLRNGDPTGVNFLNSRHGRPKSGTPTLQLTPRRDEADRINTARLAEISDVSKLYTASIEGSFPESDMPTESALNLKIGAQVMIIANGDGYVNGTLGSVVELNPDTIKVQNQEGIAFLLDRSTWDRVEFQLNGASGKIEPKVVATFKQFPVRLAWATTIHKAQGLTLECCHIEIGQGFFSHGQAYVALSRCRDASGLTLSQTISPQSMRWDPRVLNFRRVTEEDAVWRGGEFD